MTTGDYIKEITLKRIRNTSPRHIAEWLIDAEDTDYAEAFVLYWKLFQQKNSRKGGSSSRFVTKEEMLSAPIGKIAEHIEYSLTEIIQSEEVCSDAWWKQSDSDAKSNWVVSVGNSGNDNAYTVELPGLTEDELKEALVCLVMEERAKDWDSWDFGTLSAEEVQTRGDDGFYAVGCYYDYHIDYVARKKVATKKLVRTGPQYSFTEKGRKKAELFIKELAAKRKELLDAGKDTASETPLPTLDDILCDITLQGVDGGGLYFNGWSCTDNYCSDGPLALEIGKDFMLSYFQEKEVA